MTGELFWDARSLVLELFFSGRAGCCPPRGGLGAELAPRATVFPNVAPRHLEMPLPEFYKYPTFAIVAPRVLQMSDICDRPSRTFANVGHLQMSLPDICKCGSRTFANVRHLQMSLPDICTCPSADFCKCPPADFCKGRSKGIYVVSKANPDVHMLIRGRANVSLAAFQMSGR